MNRLMQLLLALIMSLHVGQDQSILTTSSGQRISGTLQSLSETTVEFETADGLESFSSENVGSIAFENRTIQIETDSRIRVTLVDGSIVNATSFAKNSSKSQVSAASGLSFEFESRNLKNVLLQPLTDQNLRSQWTTIQNTKLESGDAIVVKRNGQLETLEGIVGEVTPDIVEFKLGDRTARISREKIYGIVFYHAAGRDLPMAHCEVTLVNGSVIEARTIEISGDSFELRSPAGSQFRLPLDSVERLDFTVGRSVFLSSMKPLNRDWSPLIASSAILEKLKKVRLPRANRSFDNRPLELLVYPTAGDVSRTPLTVQFENGYAMMGGSKIVFALDRQFERLTGQIGFSPRASMGGNVVLTIRCDSRIAVQQPMLRRDNQNPLELDVDITDVQRLVIEVGYQDGRAIGDMIHLCDLKVSR